MRFVTIRDFRGKAGQIWKELPKEKSMVITSNGKPIAILSATSPNTVEQSLAALRTANAIAAVEAMQRHAVETGLDKMTLEEINNEINAVRKKRSR